MDLISSNKYTVVIGLGVTGLSAVRHMLAQGVRVIACDSRKNPPNLEAVRREFSELSLQLGPLDAELLCNAQEIVISPGLSRKDPVIQHAISSGVSVIGDIELFARVVNAPVIAITGSNGKSTVTTLVGEMAKAAGIKVAVAGNIGYAALEALADDIELYVLELSSFQLESTSSLKPVAATVLNVSADHMDRYASLMEYALTKQRIAFGAKTVVVNKQDPLTEPPIAEGVKRVCFSSNQPDLNDYGFYDGSLVKGFKALVAAQDINIVGLHNMANAAAALALAAAAGVSLDACVSALKNFTGLAHRCEHIRAVNGIDFINDSKATNVGATVAALKGLSRGEPTIHIILGGDGKGADFAPLIPALKGTAKTALVLGKDAQSIARAIHAALPELPVLEVESLPSAVSKAYQLAAAGDCVLLSPACASLDMFKNFEQRGDVFRQAVGGLS
ncbi:MAG TPA: UDP-N-acetylmuramoyl-L-alanine--D-glutamate ligase [Marinagarivorans sp.]